MARPASRLACGYRSRVATTSLDQRIDLRELRRVINVVADRTVRSRLLAQLDEDAGMPDNGALNVFVSRTGGLWACLQRGMRQESREA